MRFRAPGPRVPRFDHGVLITCYIGALRNGPGWRATRRCIRPRRWPGRCRSCSATQRPCCHGSSRSSGLIDREVSLRLTTRLTSRTASARAVSVAGSSVRVRQRAISLIWFVRWLAGVLRRPGFRWDAHRCAERGARFRTQQGHSHSGRGAGIGGEPASAPETTSAVEPVPAAPAAEAANSSRPTGEWRTFATPLVRRLVAVRGMDLRDVRGTGPNGRITHRDLDAYTEQEQTESTEAPVDAPPATSAALRTSGPETPSLTCRMPACAGDRATPGREHVGRSALLPPRDLY